MAVLFQYCGLLLITAVHPVYIMRKLTESPSLVELNLLSGYLEKEGIKTTILNEHQGGTPGVPHWALSVWAELWIVNDGHFHAAVRLFEQYQEERKQPPSADWQCGACEESNPGNFEACWRCAEARIVNDAP